MPVSGFVLPPAHSDQMCIRMAAFRGLLIFNRLLKPVRALHTAPGKAICLRIVLRRSEMLKVNHNYFSAQSKRDL
jgi:hypothetical protein